jgi:hypothetical protein
LSPPVADVPEVEAMNAESLTDADRRVLAAVKKLVLQGGPVDDTAVMAATQLPRSEVLDSLRALHRSGLVDGHLHSPQDTSAVGAVSKIVNIHPTVG